MTSSFSTTKTTSTSRTPIPVVDFYILSDVFETNTIAIGTATVFATIIQHVNPNASIWVLCHSDQFQRDIIVLKLHEQLLVPQQQLVD
jgi:hypothetical protein